MKLSKRKLIKWRKEALKASLKASQDGYPSDISTVLFKEHCKRILIMTQELFDKNLIKEE